ncbi:MAG: phosphate regulon sensor protein PhoR, partial [Luminiphilus sp.]|nr:phosphate regulon sensor protein PhoR [Luminiphilus sp.]
MSQQALWRRASLRALSFLLVSYLLGLVVGRPWLVATAALLALLVFWIWQLYRLDRWLDDADDPPPEASGVWGQLFNQIHDMQTRNREEQGLLSEALDYLRDSLKSMRDAAFIVNTNGYVVWMNASAEQMLGLEQHGGVGSALIELVDYPEFTKYFTKQNYHRPLRIDPSDKDDLSLLVEVSTFGEGDRLVFLRDITEYFRLEKMRKDFVANVSHELRTPLTVLKGYTETLLTLDDELTGKIQKPISQMDMQVQRMEVLVRDLLWLSRIESVETREKTGSVNMAGLVEEVAYYLGAVWPEREIELDCTETDDILGDFMELQSAVSNLIVNALKYSDSKYPVCVRWFGDAGQKLILEVSDR